MATAAEQLDIVDQLEQRKAADEKEQAAERQAALPGYREIIYRLATTTTQPGDDDALAAAMATLGLDFDDVRHHRDQVTRALVLLGVLKERESFTPTAGEAYEKVKRSCEEAIRRAYTKMVQENAAVVRFATADCELQQLQQESFGLFRDWDLQLPVDDTDADTKAPQRSAADTDGTEATQQPPKRKRSRKGR